MHLGVIQGLRKAIVQPFAEVTIFLHSCEKFYGAFIAAKELIFVHYEAIFRNDSHLLIFKQQFDFLPAAEEEFIELFCEVADVAATSASALR